MKQRTTTYGSGEGVRGSSGIAGVVFAVLILLGAFMNSCQDQPVDGTGVSVIRDTIRISRDSVIIRDSIIFNDSVIIRDSIIYRDSIILKDTLIVRDTVVVRDSVRYWDSLVYDTVDVPGNAALHRKAVLSYQARYDSSGLNGPLEKVTADLTDWLQYRIVDSGGKTVALEMSMSAALPAVASHYGVVNMQGTTLFFLRGLALNVPLFRVDVTSGAGEMILLNRHPYNWLSSQDRTGGLLITAQAEQLPPFLQGWTGQVIEASASTGGDRLVSAGQLKLGRINYNDRIIYAQIEAGLYVETEINGKRVTERFDLLIELELGY